MLLSAQLEISAYVQYTYSNWDYICLTLLQEHLSWGGGNSMDLKVQNYLLSIQSI